jgi:hypothetical protein
VFPIACCTPDEAETYAGLERAKNVSGSFLGGGSFVSDGLEVNSIGVSVELATAFQTEDATYEVSTGSSLRHSFFPDRTGNCPDAPQA